MKYKVSVSRISKGLGVDQVKRSVDQPRVDNGAYCGKQRHLLRQTDTGNYSNRCKMATEVGQGIEESRRLPA